MLPTLQLEACTAEDSSPGPGPAPVLPQVPPRLYVPAVSEEAERTAEAMSAQGDRLVVLSGDVGKLEAAVLGLSWRGPWPELEAHSQLWQREVCVPQPPVLPPSSPPSATRGGSPERVPVPVRGGQLCHLDLETGSEGQSRTRWSTFARGRAGGRPRWRQRRWEPLWTYGARGISILDVGRVPAGAEGKMAS